MVNARPAIKMLARKPASASADSAFIIRHFPEVFMTVLPPRPSDTNVDEHDIEEVTGQGELISEAEARFERWRKLSGVVLAPLAFALAWYLVPVTNTIKPEGVRLSAVLSAVAVLWVCETIPLPVTALLGALLC